ncbi:MAG: ribonuclease E/G, partial [Chloroflexota bacterium]
MANKMLIDASHPEETRVVVLRGNRVQEFDFEAADKKPLRGNIYLAKVTRVEPSLQAAFVDYGGNRHGFLAFAEIHPDYYQIPVADRQALLEEESRAHRQDDEEEHRPNGRRRSRRRQHEGAEKRANGDETLTSEPIDVEALIEAANGAEAGEATSAEAEAVEAGGAESRADAIAPTDIEVEERAVESAEAEGVVEPASPEAHHTISVDPSGFGSVEEGAPDEFSEETPAPDHEMKARRQDERDEERERAREESQERDESEESDEAHADEAVEGEVVEARARREEHGDDDHDDEEEHVEHIGGDAMDEAPLRVSRPRRQYKIQEVIKRRQVLLVQVVKEERGNKGAAL